MSSVVRCGAVACALVSALPRLAEAGERILSRTDATTGALVDLRIAGDATEMNWINPADGKAVAWVGPDQAWGTGTLKVDGQACAWQLPVEQRGETARYCPKGGVEVIRVRRTDGDGLYERYEFRNVSSQAVVLSEIDIHTPFRDDYLTKGAEMWTRRCHAHVWAGGSTAWICALRMGGAAPHLGLCVTEGRIDAYELKGRSLENGFSNFRGVIALSPPDVRLEPGKSAAVAWRVFAHGGKDDFLRRVRTLGGVTAEAPSWTVLEREPVEIAFVADDPSRLEGAEIVGTGVRVSSVRRGKGHLSATCSYVSDGMARVTCRTADGRETWAELLSRKDPEALIAARADFIVTHQVYHAERQDDPCDGAFVPYDNETERQYRRWQVPEAERLGADHSEGRERIAMGVFLARYVRQNPARVKELLPVLERYRAFLRTRLQAADYRTWGEVDRKYPCRVFNYPWVAKFYLALHRVTGDRQLLLDAYGTMMKCHETLGGIVLVESPERELVEALRAAGLKAEADKALAVFRAHKDRILTAGAQSSEVNFAPEGIGSRIVQFYDLWKLTGDARYRTAAVECYLPRLEACMGPQPSWHAHDIGLHHWDGYWFGKRAVWGDTQPHGWNGTGATAFLRIAEATGDQAYVRRARAIHLQELGLFDADGRAGCAWVRPDRVNGKLARFRDPLANDQDWALVAYLRDMCQLGSAVTGRQGPWTVERAWAWYDAQPWIRGCNYMPASAANRVDQWQALGSEERFAEVDRELTAAESLGFNAMRLLVEWCGFGVWLVDPDGFMSRFERYLSILDRHHMRAIVVLGNDCSRPKRIWKLPAPGEQPCDWGYHGGRKASQHGSFPGEIGFTPADDPELAPRFYDFCEKLMSRYRADSRILFWNVWNEPGNNGRGKVSVGALRRVFEIGWRADVEQPMAADVWMASPDPENEAERVAGELSDIVSYHCYGDLKQQQKRFETLKRRFGRPAINTEWLARTLHNEVFDAYPYFAQNRIGCTMWGLVAGRYQTYEPWEHMWNDIAKGRGEDYDMSKWFHDLLRPSLRPYDPRETNVICRINAEMDAEYQAKAKGRGKGSLRTRVAARCKITGEDMWYGYRRTKFDFGGRAAWVVEPSAAPAAGVPWTWTMQWAEAFVDRTGVPDLLKRGFHHATIDLFDTRMDETGLRTAAAFQKFLAEELGFAPKANLIGMSWGGFFSTRYAATHPESVAKIYLDAPLLNFDGLENPDHGRIGAWADRKPASGVWSEDPEMPVNMSAAVAAAKIPVLLVYGGSDTVVPPARNCEPFAESFRKASGEINVMKRGLFGHHPHGLDPDKTDPIVDFFTRN